LTVNVTSPDKKKSPNLFIWHCFAELLYLLLTGCLTGPLKSLILPEDTLKIKKLAIEGENSKERDKNSEKNCQKQVEKSF